jgi:hypothetical protein
MPGPTLGCSTCAQAAKGQDGTRRGLGWSWVQLAGVVLTPSGPSFPGCAGFPGGPRSNGPHGKRRKGTKETRRRESLQPCTRGKRWGPRARRAAFKSRVGIPVFLLPLFSVCVHNQLFQSALYPQSSPSAVDAPFSPQWQHPTTPIPTRHNGCAGYAVQAGACPAPSELRVNRVES